MLVALRARVDFLVDDAFISFRYARSWWENGIPVFNSFELADGGRPVEGFSNALWTGLLALAHGAGLDLVAATPWIQLDARSSASSSSRAPRDAALDLGHRGPDRRAGPRGDRRSLRGAGAREAWRRPSPRALLDAPLRRRDGRTARP